MVEANDYFKALSSSTCQDQRYGVDGLLSLLDRYVSGNAYERAQHIVTTLTLFAHSNLGCPRNRKFSNTRQWRLAVRAGVEAEYNFDRLFHECNWDPVSAAIQGIAERITQSLFFAQPALQLLVPRYNVLLSDCPMRVRFAYTRLPHIKLEQVSLNDISFLCSVLNRSTFVDITARRAIFHKANCHHGLFNGDFQRSHFIAAFMPYSRFNGDFYRAHFDIADLSHSDFSGSDLLFANFTRTDLQGANLRGCRVHSHAFSRANVDETTIFPDGTTIASHGLDYINQRWPGTVLSHKESSPIDKFTHFGGAIIHGEDYGNNLTTLTPWY